jgi:hypothetical protein
MAGRWAVTAARSVPADPYAVKERQRLRARAQGRAESHLAHAHPELYRACYQQALAQVRAQAPGLPAEQTHRQASRQAHAELQARFRDQYEARFHAELAALQPDEAVELGRVERPVAAKARLRALLWLADQHPDLARERFQAEAARLPLRAADRAPRRRRALALVRALDGLRGVFPEDFQARYTHELARQADQEAQS